MPGRSFKGRTAIDGKILHLDSERVFALKRFALSFCGVNTLLCEHISKLVLVLPEGNGVNRALKAVMLNPAP